MNKKQLVRQLSVCALVLAGLTFNGSAARAKNANTDNGTSTQAIHNLANLMTAGNALNVVNDTNMNGASQLSGQRATAQNPNGAVNQNYKSGAYWTLYPDGSLLITGTSIAGNDDFNKILYLGLNRDSVTTYISILSPKTADANIDYLFQGFKNVTSINHLDQINVSNTTSMQHTFSDDPALQSIDLSNWDTSNVTTTKDLFTGDSSLSKLVLGPKVYLTADAGLEKPKGADQWQAVGDGTDEDPKGKTFSPAELVSLYEKNNPNHPTATETYVPKPNKSSLVLTGDQTIANGADFDPTSFVKSITNADGDSIQPSDAVKDGSLKITGMPADTNTAKTYTLTFTYDGKSYTAALTIEPSKAAVQTQDKTYYTGDTYAPKDLFVSASGRDGTKYTDYDKAVAAGLKVSGNVDMSTAGTYDVTFTMGDKSVTAKVTVLANQTAVNVKDLTLYTGDSFSPKDAFVSAKDKDGNAVDFGKVTIGGDTVDTSKAGTYKVTYTYDGITTTATITVKTNQTAVNTKDLTLYTGDKFNAQDAFVSAKDKDGNPVDFGKVTIGGDTVDTSKAGTYKVTYTYDGITTTATITVKTNQTAVNTKNLTLYTGDKFNAQDAFVSAKDKDGNPVDFGKVTIGGDTVDTSKAGTYKVTYTYDGITTTATITVKTNQTAVNTKDLTLYTG